MPSSARCGRPSPGIGRPPGPVSCMSLAVWVATALTGGLMLAPRVTRLVATVLTAVTASDFLQFAYAAAQRSGQEP